MATFTFNFGGISNSYTVSGPDVTRILNRYRSPGMTDAQVAKMVADGFMRSMAQDVLATETDAAVAAARASITPITVGGLT